MFADFFHSVYIPKSVTSEDYVYNTKDTTSNYIGLPIISTSDIIDALQKIDVSKSVGNYGILPIIAFQKVSSIIEPLALLFNKSLTSEVFPQIRKKSHYSSDFKKCETR